LEKERVSSDEETLRRLVVELRILEGTAEALQARLNLVNAALTELSLAKTTLEGVEREKEEAPLFVPVGGGSYVLAKLTSSDKIVLGIGAGVSVEKSVAEAKETVGNRVADFEKTRVTLQQQLVQVVDRIQEGRAKFQELTAKMGEAERRADVQKTETGT